MDLTINVRGKSFILRAPFFVFQEYLRITYFASVIKSFPSLSLSLSFKFLLLICFFSHQFWLAFVFCF